MTRSAQSTVAASSINIKAKTDLNRQIRRPAGTAAGLQMGPLAKVDPASTSQTCTAYGQAHRDNRSSQAVFGCGDYGYRAHANHKAAINILTRWLPPTRTARGTGVSAWRGAFPSETSTIREHDVSALFQSH